MEQSIWRYRVTMHTLLGERYGTLEVNLNGPLIEGSLNILKGPMPLEGGIDPDGRCHLRGQLLTLLNTIPYTAEGRLMPEWMELSLASDYGSFYIEGEALSTPEKESAR